MGRSRRGQAVILQRMFVTKRKKILAILKLQSKIHLLKRGAMAKKRPASIIMELGRESAAGQIQSTLAHEW